MTVQDNPYCRTQMYLSTEDEDVVVIPLLSDGTIIHFSSRTPTEKELHECRHIALSSKAGWNPCEVSFPEAPGRVDDVPTAIAMPMSTFTLECPVLLRDLFLSCT